MIETYFKEITKLEKIYHISDIHIRNYKRHDEYKRVFDTLADKIKKTCDEKSIIVLTGDIVHSKTDITNELIYQVQNLLKTLSSIRPVLMIPGNHDTNLNNEHRMDSLTPIVEAMENSNVLYVKHSDMFVIGGVTFCHWSVFDNNYVSAKDIGGNFKVCMYHGAVQSAITESGFELEGGKIKPGDFKGFDITLLGDIHKFQYLNKEKTIAYPGSLIQQNHGEGLEHGILVWNLNNKTSEFVEIENDTAFYTLYVEKGEYDSLPKYLPKNLYLRVRHSDTPMIVVKNIVANIKSERKIVELSIQKINNLQEISKNSVNNELINVRDEQQQNQLIIDYLSEKKGISKEQKEEIKKINSYVNSKITKVEASRNIVWNPIRFEFENMFSYGKDNVIDFSNMRGTYGIFAANASGKSTLLDAISYCIFDKCSKTSRASQVINNSSNVFYCKLDFELNGKTYVIERDGVREKSGNVKVKVNFYYINEEGLSISLNGKERNDTNAAIRALLGNYEDFALTTLSTQSNNTGFIDMTQKDRKELLSQFLDINVFESLYEVANNEIKDMQAVVKQLQKAVNSEEIDQLDQKIKELEFLVQKYEKEKENSEQEKNSINNRILEEHILIQPTVTKNIDALEVTKKIELLKKEIDQYKNKVDIANNQIKTIEIDINNVKNKIDAVDINDLEEKCKKYEEYKNKHNSLWSKIKEIDIHLKHHKSKLDNLNELEYDENCTYCMNNVFVKDAISTKKQYETDIQIKDALELEIKEVESLMNEISYVIDSRNSYNKLVKELQEKEKLVLKTQNDGHKLNIDKANEEKKLADLQKELDTYYKEKQKIENNKQIQKRIDDYEIELKQVEKFYKQTTEKLTETLLSINSLHNKKNEYTNKITDLVFHQNKYELYKAYTEAVHRDGVPHELIANIIPKVQEEINSILEQLVDFKIVLAPDEKNINAYIAYDNDRYWPIELTSGMEKFVSSLAIRSSLINISSLPRPNFIAIDEGFGALDGNNLGSIVSYFDHLKNQFKFILIISHIDSMKDAVDKQIEINKIDGRSKVQHIS